jgi:predicted secreted hydrolase
MSWKEGKGFYLLVLLLMTIAIGKGVMVMAGTERSLPESVPGPGGSPLPREGNSAGISLGSVMGESPDDSLFARVTGPRPFVFPEDHGPHPDYRTEWWYVTGSLEGEEGQLLGYQFTLFRSAIAPRARDSRSAWGTNQIYLGHVAVTDVATGEHIHSERFARGAGGLAGARPEPFRVWLEGWELASDAYPSWGSGAPPPVEGNLDPAHPDAIFPLRLRAADVDLELDLRLAPGKGMVLQGDRGYSRKGAQPGNASFYYSYPRMPTTGTLRAGERTYRVTGSSWMDREWSTSALEAGQTGWDWFALQLDSGSELMIYQLRGADGLADPLSKGILVRPDGATRLLASGDWTLEVLDEWTSPVDGSLYPAGWRVRIPFEGLDFEVVPLVEDQEMNVIIRYWEGAVSISGREGNRPLSGRGYVELTGYAGRSQDSEDGVRIRGN